MTGIILLNYHTFEETVNCISSVRKFVSSPYHIYLVDDSCDGEEEKRLQTAFGNSDDVTLMILPDNPGYSGGNNAGARKAVEDGADAILIMNSDIILENDIVDAMRTHLSDNAVVLPKVSLPDGSNGQALMKNFRYRYSLASKIALGRRLQRYIPFLSISFPIKDWNQPVQFSGMGMGCCFLIDSGIFKQIGYLDDHVFLYFEENILGIKLEERGLKTYYEPSARVIHKHGTATEKASRAKKYYRFYRSEIYLLQQYCHVSGFRMRLLLHYLRKEYKRIAGEETEYAEYRQKLEEYIASAVCR